MFSKAIFFGYEYPMLTAAIASWHWLCGKRYLNMNQNSQLQYSTLLFRAILDPRYQMSPSVGWNGHFKELFWFLLLLF